MAAKLSVDARALPRRLIRSRWFGAIVGAIVVLAWALFLREQLAALRQYQWRIAPVAVLWGVLWGAIYFGGLGLCWALLLKRIAGPRHNVAVPSATRAWLLSMSTRYLPGNVWHILSRVAFAEQLQVSSSQVLASATIEQLLTLLGALAVFGITLPLWGVVPVAQAPLLLLVPAGLALLHPQVLGRVLALLAARLRRPELHWHYAYREIVLLLGAYSAAMACAGLSLYAVLGGLTTVGGAHIPLIIGAAAVAWAVGFLSFLTPSGLGVREAVLVALLATIYPLPVAIVASLIYRLVLTVGELGAVAVAWSYRRLEVASGAER